MRDARGECLGKTAAGPERLLRACGVERAGAPCKPSSVTARGFRVRSFDGGVGTRTFERQRPFLCAAHCCEAGAVYPTPVPAAFAARVIPPDRRSIGVSRSRRLRDLARDGVCHAPAVTSRAVRSYRTFSPLPDPSWRAQGPARSAIGGMFSVALSLSPGSCVGPGGRYPPSCPFVLGLSSGRLPAGGRFGAPIFTCQQGRVG